MIATALALLAAQVQVDPAVATAAPALTQLPAGTPMRLATLAEISSRAVVQGQRFALQVADDVTVDDKVLIPKGTPATGEVEAISGKGMFGKPARLVLQPLFVEVGGHRVNLVGDAEHRGKDATAGAAAVTLITPLGLFITGKTAVVPAGTPLFARVRSDVTLAQR